MSKGFYNFLSNVRQSCGVLHPGAFVFSVYPRPDPLAGPQAPGPQQASRPRAPSSGPPSPSPTRLQLHAPGPSSRLQAPSPQAPHPQAPAHTPRQPSRLQAPSKLQAPQASDSFPNSRPPASSRLPGPRLQPPPSPQDLRLQPWASGPPRLQAPRLPGPRPPRPQAPQAPGPPGSRPPSPRPPRPQALENSRGFSASPAPGPPKFS